jgi:uncharacterized protein (DUF1330 family)
MNDRSATQPKLAMNRLIVRTVIGLSIALAATAGQAQDAKGPAPASASAAKAVPGYLISSFTVRDPATFQKYLAAVRPVTIKYKGKAIVFNQNVRKVEGNPQTVMAVIEFPSLADAESFYFSPEYTEVRKLRIASTEGSVVLTEGVVPPRQ